jgi:hypothetical protein
MLMPFGVRTAEPGCNQEQSFALYAGSKFGPLQILVPVAITTRRFDHPSQGSLKESRRHAVKLHFLRLVALRKTYPPHRPGG